MPKETLVEKEFERCLATLPAVLDFVGTFLSSRAIGDGEAYAVTLAIEELFTNAVKFSGSSTEPIRLTLTSENNRVLVNFYDSGGEPFDITRAADVDPERPASEVRPGGLGIHLIRSVMDEVEYSYSNDANVITMIKYLE
jgi:anti-sigma regulatory factor (Ser/Thr protein kinase)